MNCAAALLSFALAAAQEPASPFPRSGALAEGINPAELQELSTLVQSFVDREQIVGAELLVIVHGREILHEGYGWRDRERELPMQPGGVFCVRSMTKPLIGAAIWMLIDDYELKLDDRASKYLPAFDVDGKREITIEQLLTHTSGLPLSLIIAQDPRTLSSLRAVADMGGACELEFEPGTAFRYSDQGTDTLTAILEAVSGMPAEEFLQSRLLEPLGMAQTTCIMSSGHPLRERTCSAYSGSPGNWSRYWSPEEAALFPIFLGSQGLYTTAVDYARFLNMYLQRGRAGRERLLRPRSVEATLRRGPFAVGMPSGFPELTCDYGQLMQLWLRPEAGGASELVAFGHSGSDGTFAWAFPEKDALVLYFTQSRGSLNGLASTHLQVEERLSALLLGVAYDSLQTAPPLEQYLGYFFEGEGDLYRAIVRDGDELALEIVGRALVPLDFIGSDRWRLRPEPSTVLTFDRNEAGAVTGYHIGDHVEVRLTPRADLPSADDVAARVSAAHQMEKLAGQGVVRLRSRLELPKLERSGESITWLAWPDRWRVDEKIGEEIGSIAFDGKVLRTRSSRQPTAPLTGEAAALSMQRDPFLRFGNWRRDGAMPSLVQKLGATGEEHLLVRNGDCTAPALTMYVDAQSWRLAGMAGITYFEGLGRIGQRVRFSDWRDVAGASWPGHTELELAHPLIGRIENILEAVDFDVTVPEGHFELRD